MQTQSDMWYVIANLEETQTEMCRSVYNSTFLVLHANMPRNRMRVTHALHILLWLRSSSLTRDYHRFDGADPVLPPPPKHGHRLTTHTSTYTPHTQKLASDFFDSRHMVGLRVRVCARSRTCPYIKVRLRPHRKQPTTHHQADTHTHTHRRRRRGGRRNLRNTTTHDHGVAAISGVHHHHNDVAPILAHTCSLLIWTCACSERKCGV